MLLLDTNELAEVTELVEMLKQLEPDNLQIIWMRCLSEVNKTTTIQPPISPVN